MKLEKNSKKVNEAKKDVPKTPNLKATFWSSDRDTIVQARRKHFGSGAAIGTKKTAGGLWGRCNPPPPQQVQGRALVGAQGAKPPQAP